MLSVFFTSERATSLADNILLQIIEDHYSKKKCLPSEEFLISFDWKEENLNGLRRIKQEESNKSMRFLALMLRGIRKYDSNAESEGYYGLNFSIPASGKFPKKKTSPVSLILSGENGSGKTSLFSSMEKISKGKSNVAALRGFHAPNDHRFLIHGNKEPSQCSIILLFDNKETVQINLSQQAQLSLPEACFCCDFDVEELEDKDNLRDFINKQIGLDSLDSFKSLIEKYHEELQTRYNEGVLQIPNDEFTKRIEAATVLIREITLEKSHILTRLGPLIKKVMEEILNESFFEKNQERFVVDIRTDGTIDCKIQLSSTSGPDISKTPREYLNTFRFKLFVFSLKLSLGICMKYFNNIDYPYVIDDMFDSSDFKNRKEIGEYFRHFLEIHDKVIEEIAVELEESHTNIQDPQAKRQKERGAFIRTLKRPQIIFLTQDDLIAESLYDGMYSLQPVIWGRLFDPVLASKTDKKKTSIIQADKRRGFTIRHLNYLNLYDIIRQNF